MKISDYMPELYKKNIEMNNIIDSEEVEMESLKNKIDTSFENTFLVNSNLEGVTNFEKLLGLSIDLQASLEDRRQRALARLQLNPPFTEAYLENYLNKTIGQYNWTLDIDYNNYAITITTLKPGKFWYNELVSFLMDILPCNLVLTIDTYSVGWDYVMQSYTTWNDVYESEMTWQDILDGDY